MKIKGASSGDAIFFSKPRSASKPLSNSSGKPEIIIEGATARELAIVLANSLGDRFVLLVQKDNFVSAESADLPGTKGRARLSFNLIPFGPDDTILIIGTVEQVTPSDWIPEKVTDLSAGEFGKYLQDNVLNNLKAEWEKRR
jgi:hypothetical protein